MRSWARSGGAGRLVSESGNPIPPATSTYLAIMRTRRAGEAALRARADKAYEVIGQTGGGPCSTYGVIDSREQAEDGTLTRAWYSHPRGPTCTWCWDVIQPWGEQYLLDRAGTILHDDGMRALTSPHRLRRTRVEPGMAARLGVEA